MKVKEWGKEGEENAMGSVFHPSGRVTVMRWMGG